MASDWETYKRQHGIPGVNAYAGLKDGGSGGIAAGQQSRAGISGPQQKAGISGPRAGISSGQKAPGGISGAAAPRKKASKLLAVAALVTVIGGVAQVLHEGEVINNRLQAAMSAQMRKDVVQNMDDIRYGTTREISVQAMGMSLPFRMAYFSGPSVDPASVGQPEGVIHTAYAQFQAQSLLGQLAQIGYNTGGQVREAPHFAAAQLSLGGGKP